MLRRLLKWFWGDWSAKPLDKTETRVTISSAKQDERQLTLYCEGCDGAIALCLPPHMLGPTWILCPSCAAELTDDA